MSDVEYYLLEKDGENSKCGVLDLGKCMDSDENSAGESTFPKEANNLPTKGEMNVCKSPENMLKDLIDMNVGVGLSTESLPGNGVNSQGKKETTIPKKTTDMIHSSSAENTHPNSTKIQGEVADKRADSKSLTEILDVCDTPSEIIAPSEMSFNALVESDDTDNTTSQSSQLQNQDIEMAEIWSGANTEKVTENGTKCQGMKVEDLKESKEAAAITEEDMETEEDSNESEESVMDQPDSSEKSKESTEISANRKERTANESEDIEAKVEVKENEDMDTTENEVEDTEMEEDVISVQDEVSEKKTVVKSTELEENAAADNKIKERDLGSSSKDDFEEVESTAMDTEEKESDNEESKEKGVETQEEGNVGELNSVDLEGNHSTKESDQDKLNELRKKSDDVSEDTEDDLADEAAGSQEKSANLIDKEPNISEETESNLADDRNSQEKTESLTNKGISLKNEKVNIHDEPEDLEEEETDEGKEKTLEKLDDAGNLKNLDTKQKNQDKTSEDRSVKIQVTSRSTEAVVESASKTNSKEKSPSKETTISETEKEIFEGPKPKSAKARPKLPPKSAEDVTPTKGKSKADDESPVAVSTGKQSNTDDGFVDYDEESIENITKTIKSFTSDSSVEKKQAKRNDSSKKADSSSKQVIVVKTSSNVERVKRKLEEILEKSKGEEDAAIAELQRMKKEKTEILNAITTEMEKLKAILVKGKTGLSNC